MKNVLRIVAGLVGILFFLNGLQWIISPANIAESLGMPLLEGGYISSIPLDPWGREYLYVYPPQKSRNFDLYTLGADGLEGGTGENTDFGNWIQ